LTRWEKHGTTSNTSLTFLHYFGSIFQILGSYVYPLKALIEVVEFRVWLKTKFGQIKHFNNKHSLLEALIESSNIDFLKSGGGVFYVEFGVAFGETSKYLISETKVPFIYHGFDTFEGLPKAWRRLPAGAFSNNGKTPNLAGNNIFFHKGLIQETIDKVSFKSNFTKIFIFDFDLYQPTLFALKYCLAEINQGDILYFDEAFDSDERAIIENYVIGILEFDVIGSSPFGLALKIK
jgi:hypothetical protein